MISPDEPLSYVDILAPNYYKPMLLEEDEMIGLVLERI
jgi:hypothetical protein